MDSILIRTLNGDKTNRPPVWFMRQAGRILPNYMQLKESYTFHELMNDKDLASKVTLLPIEDLNVDAAILFSDILVIPHALGLDVEFKKTGPIFKKPLNFSSKAADLEFDSSKLNFSNISNNWSSSQLEIACIRGSKSVFFFNPIIFRDHLLLPRITLFLLR